MAGDGNDSDDLIVQAFKAYDQEGKIDSKMFTHALMTWVNWFYLPLWPWPSLLLHSYLLVLMLLSVLTILSVVPLLLEHLLLLLNLRFLDLLPMLLLNVQ